MKKKVKRILAGILVMGIVLHSPVCLETAEAVGRKTAALDSKTQEYIIDREKISKETSKEVNGKDSKEKVSNISDDKSTDTSESLSENITEELSEDTSESMIESSSTWTSERRQEEDISKEITEETTGHTESDEEITEEMADEESATEEEATDEEPETEEATDEESETIETTDEESETEEETTDEESETEEEISDEETVKYAGIRLEVTNAGELDYRDCVDGTVFPEIRVRVVEYADELENTDSTQTEDEEVTAKEKQGLEDTGSTPQGNEEETVKDDEESEIPDSTLSEENETAKEEDKPDTPDSTLSGEKETIEDEEETENADSTLSQEYETVEDEDELADIHYILNLDNENIVVPQYMEKECIYDSSKSCFKDSVALDVIGVGQTAYSVEAIGTCNDKIAPASGVIEVHNSPLFDSDFYIEVSRGSHRQDFTYDEWTAYLQSHDNWVDGNIAIRLSDAGKKYYTSIETEVSDESDGTKKGKTYTFWAENPQKNVSTKDEDNGTRTFTVRMDMDAPVLTSFRTDSECYEPTKTNTEQYFAEEFVLNGRFEDSGIGVDRIEYTNDATAGDDAEWTEIKASKRREEICDFQITLSEGCYNAVAVRAYDMMGNVSETEGFVNDQGEYIKVIIDKSEPLMSVEVTSDGKPYSGNSDNWTNKDILFLMESDLESCPYAGIYQFEYKYEKIGETSDKSNMAGKWMPLLCTDKPEAMLELKEDKNGYYSFRAVSKSGVVSKNIVRERVLVQHQAAEIKPMIVSEVDNTKRKNEWYNKASGVPNIHFEYPDYDAGAVSKEYDAPVTMHYKLTIKTDERFKVPVSVESSAVIGVTSSENAVVRANGSKVFQLEKDSLDDFAVDFGYNEKTKTAQDGIYTLEYWITDQAGNKSEKQKQVYKIDTHEPTNMMVEIDGSKFLVGQETTIVYERFYRSKVTGKASAQYGISGKETLQIKKVKKPGEWNDKNNSWFDSEDNIDVIPDTRCFLYVQAEDHAGNVAEGWTMGVVVDNTAPNEGSNRSLIMEPEGANKHGFFNRDVAVKINVKDASDGNSAGLMSVTASVGKDGADTITDKPLFSASKEQLTDKELEQTADFHTIQVIKAAENESNNAYIEVAATDRAQNTKTSIQLLKIDVTKPKLSISFDNNNAENGSYYRQERTAIIHVTERNFDPEAVHVAVEKNGSLSGFQISDWKNDGIEHYAAIKFSEDGTYKIEASCTDLADNESEKVQTELFTIDKTAPEITLELFSGQTSQIPTKAYFNTGVTAVITVTEHNFSERDFIVNTTSTAAKGVWSHNGDVHILQIVFEGERTYHIDGAYTDLAGNTARRVGRDFTIDQTAPLIAIEGILDGSANMGEILPAVTVLDANMEESGVAIVVVSGTGESVENVIETAAVTQKSGNGFQFILRDMTDKADNVYYLTVTANDRAGNTSELTYRFSLNRNGSVYDIRKLADFVENQYNRYDGLGEIQIVEMNVDAVDEFELYISRNGELGYRAKYIKEIIGSEETGYTYIYKIDENNFAEEGTYRLILYSKDRAGNEVNNAEDIHGREISFIVDNTAPKVIINGVESGVVYDVGAQTVQIVVTDNFKLDKAVFTLVNKENRVLESWDYMELAGEGETLNITIPQYNEEVSLLYRVKDAAGNEMQTVLEEQGISAKNSVTTDKQIQSNSKTAVRMPLGRIVIMLAEVLVGVVAFLIVRRKLRAKIS